MDWYKFKVNETHGEFMLDHYQLLVNETHGELLLINLGQRAVKSTIYMKFNASSRHCKKTSWKYLENFVGKLDFKKH